MGYISMILTTVSYMPQIITVCLHKSGKNISYPYLLLLVVDVLLYLIYGVGFILDNNLDAIPMIIGACLQLVLLCILCTLKVYFTTLKKKRNRTLDNPLDDSSENEPTNRELPIEQDDI